MPVLFINANSTSDWILKIGIADKNWVRFSKRNKATITLDAYPEKIFLARVTKLSEDADQGTGAYQVELKIQTDGYKPAAGMFAKAKIFPPLSKEYKLIPVESVVEGNGMSAFVFVPHNNSVKKKPFTVAAIHKLLSRCCTNCCCQKF